MTKTAITRLRRAEGQIGGVIRMLEQGRDCKEVVTPRSQPFPALDRAAFSVVASGLKQCLADPDPEFDVAEMETLFLSLA